jgi:hypothetical protein
MPDWYRRTEFDQMEVLGALTVTGGDGTLADVTVKVFDDQDNVVATGVDEGGELGINFTPSMGVYYYKIETTARVEYELVLYR